MRCDCCGGRAVGTFIRGLVYYHCEETCEGFQQVELFDDGTVIAVGTREGREAEAGRAVPIIGSVLSARSVDFCKEEG